MNITCKIIKTGRVFKPDIIDFTKKIVIEDASMEDLEGLIGEYSFDEVEIKGKIRCET